MENLTTTEVFIYIGVISITLFVSAIVLKLLLSRKGEVKFTSTNNKVTIKWGK